MTNKLQQCFLVVGMFPGYFFRPGIYFLFICCSLLTEVYGQSNEISLVNFFHNHSERNNIAYQKDSVGYIGDQAQKEAGKIQYTQAVFQSLSRKSEILPHFEDNYFRSDSFDKAGLFYYAAATKKTGVDDLYSDLFWAALYACRFEEAMEYSKKNYETALQNKDEDGIFRSLRGMFVLNRQMGNYENSFFYAQQLHEIAMKSGNKRWLANAYWGLAELYTLTENYPVALEYYEKVRKISDKEVIQDRIYSDTEIWFEMESAELYSQLNRFDTCLLYTSPSPRD